MDKLLDKLMEKKKGSSPLPEEYKKAKMGMLGSLSKEMTGMMGNDLKGDMSKVTVAAPDKQGLSEGLDKAQGILGGDDSSEGELGEDSMIKEDLSLEDCEKLIQELEAKKAELMSKQG